MPIAQLAQPLQERFLGGHDAAFPCMGSTITAQVVSSISSLAECKSLYAA